MEAKELPEEDATPGKRSRMERAAAKWLAGSDLERDFAIRFDYVSMLVSSAERAFCTTASTILVEIA